MFIFCDADISVSIFIAVWVFPCVLLNCSYLFKLSLHETSPEKEVSSLVKTSVQCQSLLSLVSLPVIIFAGLLPPLVGKCKWSTVKPPNWTRPLRGWENRLSGQANYQASFRWGQEQCVPRKTLSALRGPVREGGEPVWDLAWGLTFCQLSGFIRNRCPLLEVIDCWVDKGNNGFS